MFKCFRSITVFTTHKYTQIELNLYRSGYIFLMQIGTKKIPYPLFGEVWDMFCIRCGYVADYLIRS